MNIAVLIIGILGGTAGLVSAVIAIGRWVGRRDSGEERISEQGRAARDETRATVKRIEDTVSTLQSETKVGFEKLAERIRPLLDRHAQSAIVDKDLDAVIRESSENRERVIRMETRLDHLERARPSRARSRKSGGL